MHDMPKRLKTQHRISAVVINKVGLFKNEIISVNLRRRKLMYLLLLFWNFLFGI